MQTSSKAIVGSGFWKITWNDGKKSKWSMKTWSAVAIQALKNARSVVAVQS